MIITRDTCQSLLSNITDFLLICYVRYLVSDKLDEPWEARRPKHRTTMRSTQLYAKAGTVVKVIISKELVGKISVG